MSEQRPSVEIIAPGVAEAITRGAQELGVPEDDLDVEVLDTGSKGLLGIGARQARVRLTVRSPLAPHPAPLTQELEKAWEQVEQEGQATDDEKALELCRETVLKLMQNMGFEAQVEAHWGEADQPEGLRPLLLNVHGNDLSTLIGRRGETLAALQYLTRLIVSKQLHRPIAAMIDVQGYRARREQQLRQMAQRVAQQTAERGRTMVLEPMPANERRIIHLELMNHPRVYTESVGEGEDRKVTIVPRTE